MQDPITGATAPLPPAAPVAAGSLSSESPLLETVPALTDWDAEIDRRCAARARLRKITALLEEYDEVTADRANVKHVVPSLYFSSGHYPPQRVQERIKAEVCVAAAYTDSLDAIREELRALGVVIEEPSVPVAPPAAAPTREELWAAIEQAHRLLNVHSDGGAFGVLDAMLSRRESEVARG